MTLILLFIAIMSLYNLYWILKNKDANNGIEISSQQYDISNDNFNNQANLNSKNYQFVVNNTNKENLPVTGQADVVGIKTQKELIKKELNIEDSDLINKISKITNEFESIDIYAFYVDVKNAYIYIIEEISKNNITSLRNYIADNIIEKIQDIKFQETTVISVNHKIIDANIIDNIKCSLTVRFDSKQIMRQDEGNYENISSIEDWTFVKNVNDNSNAWLLQKKKSIE